MLPNYGVLIGNFVSAGREQGQWLHAVVNLDAGGVSYQSAIDVNEPTLGFQYCVLGQMDPALFAPIAALPDGYHELARTPTSGAMDYTRSPILTEKLLGAPSPEWITVTGTEAGEALVDMAWASAKLYVFGAPYTTGKGTQDVHCNQGDPAATEWYASNGIWQDGCVFALLPDGTYSAYLGKFLNHTLDTDGDGNPV